MKGGLFIKLTSDGYLNSSWPCAN